MLVAGCLACVSLHAETAAQKALNAEPEMQQLRAITAEARTRHELPPEQRQGPLTSAVDDLAALRQQAHLADVLESRLETQSVACDYCASKQEELSELIRQRWQVQKLSHGVVTAAGSDDKTAATLSKLLSFVPVNNRWDNPEIAEKEAGEVLNNCTGRFRTKDNRFIPECQNVLFKSDDGTWWLAEEHEAAWARCFAAHNWVMSPAERRAYESCMDKDDPLTGLINAEKRFSKEPAEAFRDRFTVTAIDIDHLINYKDRWADKAKERVNVIREGSNIGVCNRTPYPATVAVAAFDGPDKSKLHVSRDTVLLNGDCKVFGVEYATLAYFSILQAGDGAFLPVQSPLNSPSGFYEEQPPKTFCTRRGDYNMYGTESELQICRANSHLQVFRFRWSPGDRAPEDWKLTSNGPHPLQEKQHQEFTLEIAGDAVRGFEGARDWSAQLEIGSIPQDRMTGLKPSTEPHPTYLTRTLHITVPGLNNRRAEAKIFEMVDDKPVLQMSASLQKGEALRMRSPATYKVWVWVSMGAYNVVSAAQTITADDATPMDSSLEVPVDFSLDPRAAQRNESPSPATAAAAAAVGAASTSDVAGLYDGTYTCAQRVTQLRLELTGADSNLSGTFKASIPGLPPYELRGSYRPGTRQLTLNPTRWQGRPLPGYTMVGLNGTFDPVARTLSGNITNVTCHTFSLKRMEH